MDSGLKRSVVVSHLRALQVQGSLQQCQGSTIL